MLKDNKIKKKINKKFRDSQKLREIIAISTIYSYDGFGYFHNELLAVKERSIV